MARRPNFYTYSLSNRNRELNPSQFSLASFVTIHFGNDKRGFRVVETIPMPARAKTAKQKRNYVDRQLKAYEKKRRELNEIKRKQRELAKADREEIEKVDKKELKKIVPEYFDTKYYTYSLANNQKELGPQSYASATEYTIHFGSDEEGFNEIVTRKFTPKTKTTSQKKTFIKNLIAKFEKTREESLGLITEKYFSYTDRIKVIDYKVDGEKIIVSTIKILEGLGRDDILKVRQDYLFYNRAKPFTPDNKNELRRQISFIKSDTKELAKDIFDLKGVPKQYIYRLLLTMKGQAQEDAVSQGFSIERRQVDNFEQFDLFVDKTVNYFGSRQGGKYLSLYQEFQLDGYMLERTLERT